MSDFDFYEDIDAKLPKFNLDDTYLASSSSSTLKVSPAPAPESTVSHPLDLSGTDQGNTEEGPVAIVVEGLSWFATDATVERAFVRFGKIRSLHLYDDPACCRSRGVAVVIFFRHQDAVNAQCALHDHSFEGMTLKVTFLADASPFANYNGLGLLPRIPLIDQRIREEGTTRTGHGMGGDYPSNTTWFHNAPVGPSRQWRRHISLRTSKGAHDAADLPLAEHSKRDLSRDIIRTQNAVDNADDTGWSKVPKALAASGTDRLADPPIAYTTQQNTILSYGHPGAAQASQPQVGQQTFSYFAFRQHQQQQQLLTSASQYHSPPTQGPMMMLPPSSQPFSPQAQSSFPTSAAPIFLSSSAPATNLQVDPLQALGSSSRLFPRKNDAGEADSDSGDEPMDINDFLVPTTDLHFVRRSERKSAHLSSHPKSTSHHKEVKHARLRPSSRSRTHSIPRAVSYRKMKSHVGDFIELAGDPDAKHPSRKEGTRTKRRRATPDVTQLLDDAAWERDLMREEQRKSKSVLNSKAGSKKRVPMIENSKKIEGDGYGSSTSTTERSTAHLPFKEKHAMAVLGPKDVESGLPGGLQQAHNQQASPEFGNSIAEQTSSALTGDSQGQENSTKLKAQRDGTPPLQAGLLGMEVTTNCARRERHRLRDQALAAIKVVPSMLHRLPHMNYTRNHGSMGRSNGLSQLAKRQRTEDLAGSPVSLPASEA